MQYFNIVATWPRHVISLVISSNNIPLSPLISFAYHLLSDDSPFQFTKPYLSTIGNWLSYIALLESTPSIILLQFQFLLTNIPFIGSWPFSI